MQNTVRILTNVSPTIYNIRFNSVEELLEGKTHSLQRGVSLTDVI